ncbi:hypothetical protein ACBJ59_36755 [Nonomuraea sp. MTCD27]|uniref:hypothetical protein n=1 Tax=Nonomuraea sp. MTCD27 TaxID=1676747 RepID=UPI0035BFC4A5
MTLEEEALERLSKRIAALNALDSAMVTALPVEDTTDAEDDEPGNETRSTT